VCARRLDRLHDVRKPLRRSTVRRAAKGKRTSLRQDEAGFPGIPTRNS
jgi:hypothetical protein